MTKNALLLYSALKQGGGTPAELPTLFPPVVEGGFNKISWNKGADNGGFDVTLIGTINGVTVTSPLTITNDIDGQTLVVTASADGFNSNSTSIILKYIDPTNSLYAISLKTSVNNSNACRALIGTTNVRTPSGTFSLNNETNTRGHISITNKNITGDTTVTSDFKFTANATGNQVFDCYFRKAGNAEGFYLGGFDSTQGGGNFSTNITVNIVVYDTTANETVYNGSFTNSASDGTAQNNKSFVVSIKNGHVYTFIVNATITSA